MDSWIILVFMFAPLLVGMLVKKFGQSKDIVNILLSFSGAFLLAVAVLHVLPELYFTGGMGMGKWMLGGFVLQVVLEFFSKGMEHGHTHMPHSGVFPVVVLVSLCLHSLLEGVPFSAMDAEVVHENAYTHAGHDHTHALIGMPLLAAIFLHKLPVALALSTVLVKSRVSNSRLITYLLLFAISFPAGVFLGEQLGEWFGEMVNFLALAIGMLLHISMTIIFESSHEHQINPKRFVAMIVGMGIAFFTLV